MRRAARTRSRDGGDDAARARTADRDPDAAPRFALSDPSTWRSCLLRWVAKAELGGRCPSMPQTGDAPALHPLLQQQRRRRRLWRQRHFRRQLPRSPSPSRSPSTPPPQRRSDAEGMSSATERLQASRVDAWGGDGTLGSSSASTPSRTVETNDGGVYPDPTGSQHAHPHSHEREHRSGAIHRPARPRYITGPGQRAGTERPTQRHTPPPDVWRYARAHDQIDRCYRSSGDDDQDDGSDVPDGQPLHSVAPRAVRMAAPHSPVARPHPVDWLWDTEPTQHRDPESETVHSRTALHGSHCGRRHDHHRHHPAVGSVLDQCR